MIYIYQQSLTVIQTVQLWGSTVDYPSDSLTSCCPLFGIYNYAANFAFSPQFKRFSEDHRSLVKPNKCSQSLNVASRWNIPTKASLSVTDSKHCTHGDRRMTCDVIGDDVWRHGSGSDTPLMTWNHANWAGDERDRQTVWTTTHVASSRPHSGCNMGWVCTEIAPIIFPTGPRYHPEEISPAHRYTYRPNYDLSVRTTRVLLSSYLWLHHSTKLHTKSL